MFRPLRRLFAALLIGGILFGCATNPVTGRRELNLVSTSQEAEIGKEGYAATQTEYGFYNDPALQAYVNTVGQTVAKSSNLPNLTWTFTIVDDPAVNAFAMPGGYIYITRGILPYLNSEAQLAAVLGHEIGHVNARHTARAITQQQLASLGLGIVSAAFQGFQRYGQAAQTGLGLLFLKYSRDNENEADALGVKYSTAAGYDSREMPATYVTLKRISDVSGQRLPNFLSTHPDPGSREQNTTQLAAQATAGKSGLIIRENEYIQRMNGVIFGVDPREGYFEGNHYYQPTMRFEMTFPDGWQTHDSRQAVMAQTSDGASAIQVTLADAGGLSPSGFVSQLQQSGKITNSAGRSETIDGNSAWVGRLQVQDSQGQVGTLSAAFIRRGSEMFQVLGIGGEGPIFATARSFRALSDPARLNATPDVVKIVAAPRTGSFSSVVQGLGPVAIDMQNEAILNNTTEDQTVHAGELLKIVVPGRRR